MKYTNCRLFCTLLASLLCFSLTACADKTEAGKLSETGGIGRESVQASSAETGTEEGSDSTASENPDTTTDAAVSTPAVTVPSFSIDNSKYVYAIPKPNRSTLSDLSDINAISKALFNDSGNDTTGSWYPGKTDRNLTTGEVTYVWDRSAETLAILEKYNGIYRQNEDQKVIYLTFDCGYENGWTDPILDILKEKNAPVYSS